MIKRIAVLSLLFAASAMAQPAPVSPGQKAAEIMYSREVQAHQADLAMAVQLSDQIDTLKKQVAELTSENAKLKSPTAETKTESPLAK